MKQTALTTYVKQKMPGAWLTKSKSLNIDMEVYTQRAILSICENDQLLQISKTDIGQAKIMICITNAAMMGLQFGGQFPQAEIIGFQGKKGPEVWLNIRPAGYKHMVKNSKDPILKDFTIRAIFEGEDFTIDYAKAEVKHSFDGKKKKGKLSGIYGIMVNLNGDKIVEYVSREQIENVRDNYSQTYIHKKSGAWVKSFDQMAIKTAAKQFLKPYAEEKEGKELAMAMEVDDQNPDIESRIDTHLDNIIDIETEQESGPCSHVYSRSMDQPYPRKCLNCGEVEKEKESTETKAPKQNNQKENENYEKQDGDIF